MRMLFGCIWACCLALIASDAHASGNNSGVISMIHLNGTVTGRGACIQMQPALDGSGWACLYRSNELYSERRYLATHFIEDLLLRR
jgi:hypothetical protein